MKLNSLSDIFERRLLRIPDYQRGYAWNEHQVADFWEDILQLDSDRIHYTGVITLEPVKPTLYQRWEKDLWLIEGVGFRPFYVVDGQQRLTTSMILLQAILETVPKDSELNYQSITSIRKQFIFFEADNKLQQSFIFGYEKDNPSDEYMKTKIFLEHSGSNQFLETLYTRNLSFAKRYFKECLEGMSVDKVVLIYKKLTQKLKFNLYEIDEEIDVFVTFETMNNRGKPLTSLELLKNRLIYLSTLFKDNDGREQLRININDAWKTMYEYLGKNPDVPLSDNLFLRNHWTMYFKYTRKKGDDYIKYLLEDKFSAKNVTHPSSPEDELKIEEVSEYVKSLQQSIVYWFYIHNPYFAQTNELTESHKRWLDRLERLSFRSFKPLILSAFVSKQDPVMIEKLLEAAERYNFTLFNLSQRRANTGDTEFFSMSRDLLTGEKTIAEVLESINQWINKYYDPDKFLAHIEEKYELDRDGFYHWDGVRYFLYEHEQWLREKGKQATSKLSWDVLKSNKKDHVTLEHIFPQTPDDEYWKERFDHLSELERRYLTHSLGNLLPLSRSKNSALQNDSFTQKVNNGEGIGYYNGSVSENEVAQYPEWTPAQILKRGLDLLHFMEQRWIIELGDFEFKGQLLHLAEIDFSAPERLS
ncbi:DUF262 domain-containing HNH endonuclease family protein [Dasania sp. GY-19]|uniref:DUF262 domain-containing HNH endonuclease family protein n=1 Tax=Dasania phycosphaerae TaxID=2950436 RepID=A0A9J6RR32_9GAMM|nr:DUF262 domain-containing HNH endonuclease family protein [Dasania phycosphaerae]MCZ0867150.1 DUF262 domain-containing HNH endonuclease family protein [Dasania phycosphaerae]